MVGAKIIDIKQARPRMDGIKLVWRSEMNCLLFDKWTPKATSNRRLLASCSSSKLTEFIESPSIWTRRIFVAQWHDEKLVSNGEYGPSLVKTREKRQSFSIALIVERTSQRYCLSDFSSIFNLTKFVWNVSCLNERSIRISRSVRRRFIWTTDESLSVTSYSIIVLQDRSIRFLVCRQ